MTQATIDLIWWIGGGVVAVLGLALLVWALIGDRSRGRKRCPKCWYDMSSAPRREEGEFAGWVCPECGKRTTRERELGRTRRRKRWVVFATVLAILGIFAAAQPRVLKLRWWSVVPAFVLVPLATSIERSNPVAESLFKDLYRRAPLGGLSESQRIALGVAVLPDLIYLRDRWPAKVPVQMYARPPYWFAATSPVRMTLTPIGSPLEQVSIVASGWLVRPAAWSNRSYKRGWSELGTLQPGSHLLKFDCVIETGSTPEHSNHPFEPERVMWRGIIERQIEITPNRSDVMNAFSGTEAESAARAELVVTLANREHGAIVATVGRKGTPACADTTFALSLTLEQPNQVILFDELLVYARNGPPAQTSTYVRMPPLDTLDSSWFVRVRSVPDLALLDTKSVRYWKGQFTIPLSEVIAGPPSDKKGKDDPESPPAR